MRKERNPPQTAAEVTVKISGTLAALIADGAQKSGLTPKQYVLSLLWHNVPLAQKSAQGLPDCVQLVMHDIRNYYCSVQDPYEAAGMTRDDFCGSANGDELPF